MQQQSSSDVCFVFTSKIENIKLLVYYCNTAKTAKENIVYTWQDVMRCVYCSSIFYSKYLKVNNKSPFVLQKQILLPQSVFMQDFEGRMESFSNSTSWKKNFF